MAPEKSAFVATRPSCETTAQPSQALPPSPVSAKGNDADAAPGETAPTENAGGDASPVEAVNENAIGAPARPRPFTAWARTW